jgi:hypothetical protein
MCYLGREERVRMQGGRVSSPGDSVGHVVLVRFLFCFSALLDHILFFVYLQIGPLRCWPGGLCLSRSIGDQDVGEFIVPVPLVKQIKV